MLTTVSLTVKLVFVLEHTYRVVLTDFNVALSCMVIYFEE